MWRKSVFYVVFFFLLATSVFAADAFDTSLITRQEVILPGESALFSLDITNNLDRADRYAISPQDVSYIVFLEPRPTQISASSTGRFGVEVAPRGFVSPGAKVVPLRVRSLETQEEEIVEVLLVVRDPDDSIGVYTPSVALAVSAPDQLDPREDLVLNIHLRNRNARAYDAANPLLIRLHGDLFSQEFSSQLGGVGENGERSPERRIDLAADTPPGEYSYTVEVIVDDRTVSEVEKTLIIDSYSIVEQDEFIDGSLFKTTTTYKIRNYGNVATNAEVVFPAAAASRLFISASENYEGATRDGDSVIVFSSRLEPGEEQTITVTENYRLLALLGALIIISLVGYFLLRSPILVDKQAYVTGSAVEGSSEIKVRVLVKNRSAKSLRNVRVIDRASEVASVTAQEGLGTIKPTKIAKKKGQGTLLRWDLDVIEPYEERIISYGISMPLRLVGDLQLPSVKVRFDLPSGRERSTHSNEATVTRR